MESKYACVVDSSGQYITSVLIEQIPKYADDGTFSLWEKPHAYVLKDDESLLYERPPKIASRHPLSGKTILSPGTILKPRWNGSSWEETATPEEIVAAQPEPVEHQPTDTEIIMLAVTELYEKYEKVLGGAPA